MAEENAASQETPVQSAPVADAAAENRSLRAAVIGTSIIMWILAVFIINALNGIKSELQKLNKTVNEVTIVVAEQAVGRYQIVDKNGNVMYKFQSIPAPTEGGVPEGGSPMEPSQ